MNVTLISPYGEPAWDMTTRMLSSILKRDGHKVRLVFAPIPPGRCYPERVCSHELPELTRDSDVIGISLMTNFYPAAAQITQALKCRQRVPIVWGGVHPTIRPRECLDYADVVCIGDGDAVLPALLKRMEKGIAFNDIPGIGAKIDGRVSITDPECFFEDVDSLPFQDFSCEDDYLVEAGSTVTLDEKVLKREMWCGLIYGRNEGHFVYHTLTSRGCPFRCTFCINSALLQMQQNRTYVRRRSVNRIIEEFCAITMSLPFVDCFLINDDDFFARPKAEIALFGEEYKKRVGMPLWITGLHVSSFDEGKFAFLVEAGLRFVRMGIQTGSERSKKLYNRLYSNERVEASVKGINKFRHRIISSSFDIILDNPWETEDDLKETLLLLSRLPRPFILELYSLRFFPGSALYDKAKSEGLIRNDFEDIYCRPYSGVRATYMNNLFRLMSFYAQFRIQVLTPKIVLLLTDRRTTNPFGSWVVYRVLRVFPMVAFLLTVVFQGTVHILHGDFASVFRWIKERIVPNLYSVPPSKGVYDRLE